MCSLSYSLACQTLKCSFVRLLLWLVRVVQWELSRLLSSLHVSNVLFSAHPTVKSTHLSFWLCFMEVELEARNGTCLVPWEQSTSNFLSRKIFSSISDTEATRKEKVFPTGWPSSVVVWLLLGRELRILFTSSLCACVLVSYSFTTFFFKRWVIK